MLGQSRAEDGGAQFEVVGGGGVCVCGTCRGHGSAGADNGAVLGHVNAAVDVSVAVEGGGEAGALGLRYGLLASGAGFVLAVQHQLDPALSAALLKTTKHTYTHKPVLILTL